MVAIQLGKKLFT